MSQFGRQANGLTGLRRSTRRLAVTTVIASTVALLAACTGGGHEPSAQQSVAQSFLNAVSRHDTSAAAALTTAPSAAGTALAADATGLSGGGSSPAKATLRVTGVETHGDDATAAFRADWALPGITTHWAYTGSLSLHRDTATNSSEANGGWHIVWRAAELYPGLTDTTHLAVVRTQPKRGTLLDSDGKALFSPTPVVRVGVEPKLVHDLPTLARTLAAVPQLQSTAAQITSAVKAAAHPTDFVPVITLRRPVYDSVRGRVHDLPGTVFQEATELLTPTTGFGQPLLGTVGPATAAVVTASKGRIAATDQTGLGGLQQALDATLAGTTGVRVVAADAGGQPVRTLATLATSKPGQDVTLTLDRSVQTAAENAIAKLTRPATIVALDRTTGAILADANNSQASYDMGLSGAYPAGSTFKIATWAAAFTADPTLKPSTKVGCPATVTVDGRQFENENKFSHGSIPVSAAFGYSCNTSAITAAMELPPTALADTAKALGLGATWSLPVQAFSGSVPAPTTDTERAADAIGQGRVQVSPLLMALMAGAASSGTPVRPTLIAGRPASKGAALPSALVSKMNALMKATVDLPGGTGHALADLPGVEGKTGTAEYGTAMPPRSHAWFAGVQGNLAFAVFIYDGASAHIDPSTVSHTFLAGRH